MNLLPGAITDFFGQNNYTIGYRFSTESLADYGNLRMNIEGAVQYPMIIQLTNEGGEIQREIYATEPKVYDFNTISPSKYVVRVIFDSNGNGTWDTGSYLKNIQPEKVSYYPDLIDLRANWELEQTFTILN